MIEQKLHAYYKRFATISPRADFVARSRGSITHLAQEPVASLWRTRIIDTLTASGALALASFLLLAIVAGISYATRSSGVLMARTGLNDAALTRETTDLAFKVQIKDAEYFDESASQVARALDTIVSDAQVQ